MMAPRHWGAIVVLNALLATAVFVSAPPSPVRSDRDTYEGAGQIQANCRFSIYCYRFLVPLLLDQVPLAPELRWRAYQLTANTLAGSIVAGTAASLANGLPAAVLASVLVQTSFGFTFTAYDPFTADPMVFLVAAVIGWCWMANRTRPALAAGLFGIFAKETVALVSVSTGLAALVARNRLGWPGWVRQAALVFGTLVGFHWLVDTYYGWDMSTSQAVQLSEGAWIKLWWLGNPGLLRKAFLLFMPFGFGWLYAVAGYRAAPPLLRQLTLGALLPFLALNYGQNPERALANTFFFVVPLAIITLSRVPLRVAALAAITNGLFTAKVGASVAWLPASSYLFLPAMAAAVWTFWCLRTAPAAESPTAPGKVFRPSSRT